MRKFINRMFGRPHTIRIWCKWDKEAGVWYVAKSEFPGIAAEAENLDELGKTVALMIEDLKEEAGGNTGSSHRNVPIELLSRFPAHAHC